MTQQALAAPVFYRLGLYPWPHDLCVDFRFADRVEDSLQILGLAEQLGAREGLALGRRFGSRTIVRGRLQTISVRRDFLLLFFFFRASAIRSGLAWNGLSGFWL